MDKSLDPPQTGEMSKLLYSIYKLVKQIRAKQELLREQELVVQVKRCLGVDS
jgi:hypothetical protein